MPSLEFQFILDSVSISLDRASMFVGPADPIYIEKNEIRAFDAPGR
jgi:hypothetical protein